MNDTSMPIRVSPVVGRNLLGMVMPMLLCFLLGFCRGHHLQRQVPKFLPPFRAAIALCEDVVTITTSIVAATCAVATTTSGPTAAAASVATYTYTFDDISTKP